MKKDTTTELLKARKRIVSPPPGLDVYSYAYRAAALELAGNHTDGGAWAHPIVFLHRHSIELLIKATLRQAGSDAGICLQNVLGRSHDLARQLPDLHRAAAIYGLSLSETLNQFIAAFHEHDPTGMKARYPLTKNGDAVSLEHGECFELKPFVADCELVLDELENLLSAVYSMQYCEILEAQGIPN